MLRLSMIQATSLYPLATIGGDALSSLLHGPHGPNNKPFTIITDRIMKTTNQSQAYYEKHLINSPLFREINKHLWCDELLKLISQQINEDNDLVIG